MNKKEDFLIIDIYSYPSSNKVSFTVVLLLFEISKVCFKIAYFLPRFTPQQINIFLTNLMKNKK